MKRLLFFPGHRIIAYEWDGGVFHRVEAFEPDEDGRAAFRRWLEAAPRTPVRMLVDVIEEEFHVDHVPHVLGRERWRLYQRTRRTHFRGSEYAYITSLGRLRQGRRDDQVLVAGLTNPELLNVWLDVLADVQVPLSGIHSLPLVGEYLLPYLGVERAARVLVISQQVASTLRVSYYERGRLHFSRLVPGRYHDVAEYADFVQEELRRTLYFLANQRSRGQEQRVETYVLADSNAHDTLRQRLAGNTMANCHLVSLADLAARTGERGGPPGPFADTLFAQLLLRRWRPANHYGLARLRHFFFVQRARIGLRALGAAAVVAAVAVSGFAWIQGRAYDDGVADARARQARFERLYEQRLSQLDAFDYRAVDVKNAVDVLAAIAEGTHQSPEPAMNRLGRVLTEHPQLRVEQLEWSLPGAPGTSRSRGSPGVTASGPPRVTLNGRVAGIDNDYRRAIGYFDAFVRALRDADFGRVSVLQAPFDLEPSAGVTGDTGTTAGDDRSASAEFAIGVNMDTGAGDDG